MNSDRTLLTRAEVAARLGHSLVWFYRNEKRIQKQERFPAPALGTLAAARWDPAAIDYWLDCKIRRTQEGAHPIVAVGLSADHYDIVRRAQELASA